MDINITGNPGTGNTYNEINIHIDHVENFNPNATTVVNNYGHHFSDDPTTSSAPGCDHARAKFSVQTPSEDVQQRLSQSILTYVRKLIRHVKEEYVVRYEQLWRDILTIPEVATEVYDPGKQQGTPFNRKLVAGIICMMKDAGIITETNVSRLTEHLEGDKDHSVRAALGTPPAREIYTKVRAKIEDIMSPS